MPFIYRYYSIQIISYVYLFVRGRKDYDGVFIQSLLLFFLYSLNAWNLTCGDDSLV